MMVSSKVKLLLLVVSLFVLFHPTRPFGDHGLLVLPILCYCLYRLLIPPVTSLLDGVSTEYAFAPEGYESDDPVADLIPAWRSVSMPSDLKVGTGSQD